ncbi:DUF3667 domain-containing protein [Gillisia sp. CAL575]|uniref:DUF3667 domain-containing protein n=1 Tax=Gillisia sp. CAL575 TaxID=985255 RepID=UPI00039A09EB|nr:DUF3667 domain-containing protein [Gillisia sp. CAL575]
MADIDQCKNCEETFDASFDYCPYCGQETADNLTFGVLFRNTISNYFSIDARFFKSFIPLMTKPGVLARCFVDGKRLSYLHPAQFYLFISVVFFFSFSFTIREADNKVTKALKEEFNPEVSIDSLPVKVDPKGMEAVKKALKENQENTGMSDEEIREIDSLVKGGHNIPVMDLNFKQKLLDSLIISEAPRTEKLEAMGMKKDAGVLSTKFYSQLLKLYEQRGGGILQSLYDTIPIAMFFMLPLFALLLKLFYWRRGKFAHHLVFSFYFFTFLFTTFCILILLNTFLNIPIWVDVLVFVSFVIYLTLALRHFYKNNGLVSFLKASVIYFIFSFIVLPLAMIGVIFVSFLLY